MSIDPQTPFWHAIERDPSVPGPRLVFADWCAENGLATMAEVQRWLAATGRYPVEWRTKSWNLPGLTWRWINHWYRDWHRSVIGQDLDNRLIPAVLPQGLFEQLFAWYYSPMYSDPRTDNYYLSLRTAEKRLAAAWRRATRPRRWYTFWHRPWVPDWTPVALVSGEPSTEPTLGEEDRP